MEDEVLYGLFIPETSPMSNYTTQLCEIVTHSFLARRLKTQGQLNKLLPV